MSIGSPSYMFDSYGLYDGFNGSYMYSIPDNDSYNYIDGEDLYQDYLYIGFQYERPIYIFAWPILVLFATIANVLLILTLLQKTLRTAVNAVLIGIAAAETFSLLVTIPTYILAYITFDDGPTTDVYILSKFWCNAFMVIKFFFSKSFRTTSIWLHCFLGFHRLMAIWKPFRYTTLLSTRFSIVIIVLLYICAPFPHISRAVNKYSISGVCAIEVEGWCNGGCTHSWVIILLVDLVPCSFLSLFTTLMVIKLMRSTRELGSTEMLSHRQFNVRREENRRSSVLVTVVVLSLLIPEIPYIAFLLYLQANTISYSIDRKFHTVYEVLIALSYTTNFFINTALNKTFREELSRFLSRRLLCFVPRLRKLSVFTTNGNYDVGHQSDSAESNELQVYITRV